MKARGICLIGPIRPIGPIAVFSLCPNDVDGSDATR
jgi:hypothetical protein